MTLRCLVIDDEPLALNILADYINKTNNLQLIDVTTNPVSGLARIMANDADLVFLDIQMPKLNGLELMQLAAPTCKIILTTAYSEYAAKSYDFNVSDYLLKPISYERFLKAIKKVSLQTSNMAEPLPPDFFFVKSEYKLVRIDYADVLYLESLRDYVAIHTTAGQKILTLKSMMQFEKELPPLLFIRIHKSYIIAKDKVSTIEKNKVVLNNISLPVGDTYRNNFMKHIG